jgi:glucose-6-phosphate 1-dehydrogenase
MGRNLVLNMADHGHSAAGYDKDGSKVVALRQEAAGRAIRGAASMQEFIGLLQTPRAVMVLVPAGPPVDAVIRDLLPCLERGDLVIDGGNSHFSDLELRTKALAARGIQFLGVGISGGEHGARHGPSIMPGGPRDAYEGVRRIFEAVAARVNGEPCVTWLGPGSAGHYVKMVHNGIEYGLMGLIAETYDLMKRGLGLTDDELHDVYDGWNHEELNSYLVEITAHIFRQADEKAGERLIDVVLDEARQNGTGRWTSQEALHQRLLDGVKKFARPGKLKGPDSKEFARHITYQQGDFQDPATYSLLARKCAQLGRNWRGQASHVFRPATPTAMIGVIPGLLAGAGLNQDRARARIVVEKPIGHDLDSARELNRILTKSFHEAQIFRIDHYLGKETVQNILAFRFANPLFEPIWNRRYVDHVTITVAETVGVGHRGGYYEHAGALRDMVQNHLLQLLCLVAMEPMISFEADELRDKKLDVLHAVRRIRPNAVRQSAVPGQYAQGLVAGKKVCGYRQEDNVSPRSRTETFAALKLFVDNWRWEGVSFYLITGKCLPRQVSEIAIQFRNVPHQLFPREATRDWHPSRLVLSIQPEEAIVLRFQAKYPGPQMQLRPVQMHFNYRESFSRPSPDAYETLLMRADQVAAAWQLLMPILDGWAHQPARDFPNYAAGSWGPKAARKFLGCDDHKRNQSNENPDY